MKHSSSRYTSSPSPRPTSHPPSSNSRNPASPARLCNREAHPELQHHLLFSPIPIAPQHWNWHAQTRWTRSYHGLSLVSAFRLWRSSNLSTSYNWSRLADGWLKETVKRGGLLVCQERRTLARSSEDERIDGDSGHGDLWSDEVLTVRFMPS